MPARKERRIVLVPESQAGDHIREIYEKIKVALGLPYVNLLFQAYAAYPKFLDLHWEAVKPMLGTAEFFQLAERIRAEAYTRAHNYFSVPDFCSEVKEMQLSEGARRELTDLVELFHYNNPLLLLIVAAQLQAFDETPVTQKQSSGPAVHPVFREKPSFVPEDHAPERIRAIYEDIKRTLGLTFINSDYRAFGRFPDFLEAYWLAMKPALISPIYSENKRRLRDSGTALASELPHAPRFTIEQLEAAGLDNDEIAAVVRISEQFLDLITGLILNVSFAKIGLEGGTDGKHRAHGHRSTWGAIEPREPARQPSGPKQAA